MTDNYQFDKNSKLFQKFLALKANKNNESFTQRPLNNQSNCDLSSKIDKVSSKGTQTIQSKSQKVDQQSAKTNHKHKLHATIKNIESVTSTALDESSCHADQMKTSKIIKERSDSISVKNRRQQQIEHDAGPIEANNERYVLGFTSKNERNFTKKARQLQSKPQNNVESKEEKIYKGIEQSQAFCFKKGKFEERLLQQEKENIQSTTLSQEILKGSDQRSLAASKEHEYLKKIQKLNQKNEELKHLLQQESKDKQRILSEKQAQIQTIKQKYFQLRSNQDSLTSEVKRYKEKLQSENLFRTKFEQEVKQLNFRIVQLQQMLQGKQSNLKKRTDEISYWKSQNQQIKSQTKQVMNKVQSLQQRCQFYQSQNKILQKDVKNKQQLIQEIRKNMNSLIQQNTIAKDQIYKLTLRLYQMQQMNLGLKGDLQRREKDQGYHNNSIQDSYQRSIQNIQPKRNRQRVEQPDFIQEKQQRGTKQANNGRRREFARERATKPERNEELIDKQHKNFPERGQRKQLKTIEPQRLQPNKDLQKNSNSRQIVARIEYLQAELQVRSKMKSITGKMRKEKIDMQRELQQLLNQ